MPINLRRAFAANRNKNVKNRFRELSPCRCGAHFAFHMSNSLLVLSSGKKNAAHFVSVCQAVTTQGLQLLDCPPCSLHSFAAGALLESTHSWQNHHTPGKTHALCSCGTAVTILSNRLLGHGLATHNERDYVSVSFGACVLVCLSSSDNAGGYSF